MTRPVNASAISVLIRTFDSAKTLDRLLSSLKLEMNDEYLVIDSGSTDSTLAIASVHGARIINAPGPFNYSKSLNLGFREARNPWVLVISSHSLPVVSNLLEVYRSAAREFPADVEVGYAPNSLNGQGPFADDAIRYYDRDQVKSIYSFCGNGNTLYRWSAWEKVPFDETIRTGEDKAWLDEILVRSSRIAYISAARTINISQYSLRYMFLKGYSDMRALSHQPQSILNLGMALGSHTKKFLQGGMPAGNWIRYAAHIVGQYFGSHQSYDNTPGQ